MRKFRIGARVMIIGSSPWHDYVGTFMDVVYNEDLDRYLFMIALDDGIIVSVENPLNLHPLKTSLED
jgi:hypothetical protein